MAKGSTKGGKGAGKGPGGGQRRGAGGSGQPVSPLGRNRILFWILLAGLAMLWIVRPYTAEPEWTPVPYSQFRALVEDGMVERVNVKGSEIRGELTREVERTVPDRDEPVTFDRLITHVPAFGDDELLSRLEAQGVEVQTEPESDFSWWLVLVYMLPVALIIILFIFLYRGMQSQGQKMMSIGKSRARAYERTEEATTFADVAGQAGAKQELEELVSFLKDPSRFERLGGEIPRGFLLVGPPGTGKTLIARAVAGEAGVPFFHMSGSDFMEMLVGVGASRVRSLFEEAKEAAPAIVFIDELDSVGRKRGAGLGGGHDEREQTLNQLLSEMDGFEPNEGVVVMAATNRPDILDPALLRPGRFDRRVTMDLPTRDDREAILKIHAKRKPLSPEVDLAGVARGTPGFSGADLRNLLNESALLAARKDLDQIRPSEIDEARDKIMMGLERKGVVLTDEERRLLAYHEAGHAVAAAMLPNADPVHKVSIIPRGRAMGVTQQLPERDRYLYSRDFLEGQLVILLAGRAAEELVLDTMTSGAEDDLKRASQLARKMVLSWGMSDRFGRIASGGRQQEVFLGEEIAQRREFSDSTSREVDEEVRAIVENAFQTARSLLEEHREGLDGLAEALLAEEEVSGRRVMKLLGKDPSEVPDARTDGMEGEAVEADTESEKPSSQQPSHEERSGEQEEGMPAEELPPDRAPAGKAGPDEAPHA